jgi:hypothetical protein
MSCLFDKCFQKFTGYLISFPNVYEICIQNKQIHLNLLTLIFVKMSVNLLGIMCRCSTYFQVYSCILLGCWYHRKETLRI